MSTIINVTNLNHLKNKILTVRRLI